MLADEPCGDVGRATRRERHDHADGRGSANPAHAPQAARRRSSPPRRRGCERSSSGNSSTLRISNRAGGAEVLGCADELVGVGANEMRPVSLTLPSGRGRAAQDHHRRARGQLQVPADDHAGRFGTDRNLRGRDAMPASRIMSSVETSSALTRGSFATSGTSQACTKATGRPSIRYSRSNVSADPARSDSTSRPSRAAARRARTAPGAARGLRLSEQRAERPCNRFRSCHRRQRHERALALLAHDELLAHQLVDGKAHGDAADREPPHQKFLQLQSVAWLSAPERIALSTAARAGGKAAPGSRG